MVKKTKYSNKYLPKSLSKKDKKKQKKSLNKSRKDYLSKKYYNRPKVKSYKSKPSSWTQKFHELYPNSKSYTEISKVTGIPAKALKAVVRKGRGAYYSSGSRPNQTGHSWGRARLASAITGGKAAAVDFHILEKSCKKNSKALKLAKRVRGTGTRRVKKIKKASKKNAILYHLKNPLLKFFFHFSLKIAGYFPNFILQRFAWIYSGGPVTSKFKNSL